MTGGVRCSVVSCTSNQGKDKDVSFFSFPKDPKRRNEWIRKCNRGDKINPDNARICSLHFLSADYERNLKAELLNLPCRKKLKPNAVPSLLLKPDDTTPREERALKKQRKEIGDLFERPSTSVAIQKLDLISSAEETFSQGDLQKQIENIKKENEIQINKNKENFKYGNYEKFMEGIPNKMIKARSHLTSTAINLSAITGRPLQELLRIAQEFAPLNLAESWDNVGLLVDPMEDTPVKVILLTNDLTEDVLDEAIAVQAGLIISYHPNIFQGLKCVTSKTWKERIVVKCIRNNIAVFSPHTSWDAVQGGVNDWLGDAFVNSSKTPINENPNLPLTGAGRLCTLKNAITVKEAIEKIKSHIGIPHLRLALAKNKTEDAQISTVALCAGSGSSVLRGVQADLYLTGEMLHHDILDATQKGIHVILCNHSDSERGFLKVFQSHLKNVLQENVEVVISGSDRDPLETV